MKLMQIARAGTALLILSTLSGAGQALADDGPQAPLTGNLGLFSSYRFRGLDQTFGRPAVQGGIDYIHPSGFYVGNWNSNVNSGAGYPGGKLEMDFYGGYRTQLEALGIDVGALHYAYPGTRLEQAYLGVNQRAPGRSAGGQVSNDEIYLAASWEALTVKYSHAVSDYFSMPGTRGTGYLDLGLAREFGGYLVGAHIGRLLMHNFSYLNSDGSHYDGSYTDWRIAVSRDLSGWVLGIAYIGSDAQGRCNKGQFYCFSSDMGSDGVGNGSHSRDGGRDALVFSVVHNF